MSFLLSERYGTNLALGDGPVYPSIMGDRPGQRTGYGLARLTRGAAGGDGRYPLKMLWIRAPSYRGPASVRGTNTGTGQTVAWMIASPQELQLAAGGRRGFREWVTTAMLPGPGCYRLDVRGSTFHDTISFRATFE